MSLDPQVLQEFTSESEKIIVSLLSILNQVRGHSDLALKLEDFGNQVDRIMGAAQSLVLAMPEDHALDLIADYSSICKSVAYRAAKLSDNPTFYETCVTLLTDGTKALQILIKNMHLPFEELKVSVDSTMIERFRGITEDAQKDPQTMGGLESEKMSQTEIDDLMKKISN